jgi:hypothetical protein
MNNSHQQKRKLSEQALHKQLNALDKEITPERDLWQGIEFAIERTEQQSQQSGYRQPLAWAASVLLAVLVGWGGWQLAPQKSVIAPANTLVASLAVDFSSQRQAMLVSLGQPDLNALDPKIKAQFDEFTKARQALHKALADDPQNTDLLNLLSWLQQQELALLEQLYRPQWQTI